MRLFKTICVLGCLLALAAPLQAQTCNASMAESTPATEFTDHGNGTVTHSRTGLMWKRCAEGQTWSAGTCGATADYMTWAEALTAARNANFAGYTDWRVPNIKELKSIVEDKCYGPSINTSIFPGTPADGFWSASAYVGDSSYAWYVNFGVGYANLDGGKNGAGRVRLVRAGQSFGSFDVLSGAQVFVTPNPLTFGAQNIGSTSAAKSMTLDNTGGQALVISSIAPQGNFAITANNCPSTLPVAASCTLGIRFTPTASGTLTGSVNIISNASGSPHIIQLTGTGQGAALSVSATSLSFSSQFSGTTSSPQAVTLSNIGGAAVNFTSIVVNSDFGRTTTCGPSLAPGANCTVSVTFAPTEVGPYLSSLVITSDAVGSPHTVSLSGTGLPSAGVALSPSSLTFAGQLQGSPSAAKTITLLNSGTAALTLNLNGITTSGDFGVTHNCGTGPAAGASCTLYVVFTPMAVGNLTGSVSISSNAPGGPHSVGLSGTGLSVNAPACTLSATPPSVRKDGAARLTAICSPAATSYNWTGGTCAAIHTATCDVTPATSTSYSVSGINSFGASPIATATVTVRSADLTPILMLLLD